MLDDDADEPNETFTVTLSSPSATAALADDPSATGTITDNDGPPALSIDDATAEEGETSMVFTAKLDKASGSDVRASWSTADDTASAPADYTAVTNGSISILAGSLSTKLTVTLNVAENEDDEPDKQFSVTLANLANAASGDLTATGTIADDDLPNVSLHARFVTIVEGANAQFELTRDGNLVVPLEVRLAVTQDGDFLAETAPTSARFDANAETFFVALPTANDKVDEAAGSITLTLLSDTTYTIVLPASATVTVTDNDLPTLTVAADDTEVIEGSSAEFRVTRAGNDHGAALDFQVFAAASDGYFVEASFVDGTIAAGSSSAAVSVAIQNDVFDGDDGELTVAMSPSNAYRVGTPAQVTIDIRDDDEAGTTPKLSVLNRPCFEDTDVQPCIVLLQLDRAATAAFTVRMNTADGTARGSATGAGADFKHVRGERVRFAIGDRDYFLDALVLTGDRTDEEDETFSVIVTLAAGTDPAAVTIANGTGTVTITDDDPPASVSLDDASAAEGDGSIGFVARLNPVSGKEITLAWTATDGTATVSADLTERTGTVTFAAGDTSRTIAVPLEDDAVTEPTETFQLTLSRTGTTDAEDVELEDATATGTITDDDAVLSLTVRPTTISENEQATVTVSADAAPSASLTISLVVTGGTAAAGDYTITPASITIDAGTTSGSATVMAVDDDLVEGSESIALSVRLGGTEIGSASITITDNDSATWELTVSPVSGSVIEGQEATVTASTGGVTFDSDQTVMLQLGGDATGTDDYTIAPASITIALGETSGTAIITTEDDALVEVDETITIAASHDGEAIGTRNVTITDNDTADFSLTADTATITEQGASSATVTVSTGGATFATVQTISLDLDGSATEGTDYTITPASIMIAPGATEGSATVTAEDDNLVEGSERIEIAASQGATEIGSVQIDITDNDDASFSVEVDEPTITEEGAGSATVTVAITGGVTFDSDQTIALALGGSATAAGRLHDHVRQHHDHGRPDRGQRDGHGGGRPGSGGGGGGDHHHRGHARRHGDRERGDRHHGQRRAEVHPERVHGHRRREREHDR